MNQDPAVERIPVEIWKEIFDSLALSHPKGEFSQQGEAYVFVDKALSQPAGVLGQEEEDKAIKDRLAIVLVCKRWYSIGVQALWGHLRIKIDRLTKCGIKGICRAIKKDGDLATFVTRLTIQSTKAAITNRYVQQELLRFIPYLVSLKIFVCPRRYAVDLRISALDVVILRGPEQPIPPRYISNTDTMFIGVATLRIDFSEWYRLPSNWMDVRFPRLENLNISVIDALPTVYITQHWILPKLRILSITAHKTAPWLNFIQRWNGKLHTLELVFGDVMWPRSIDLPVLERIIFSGRQPSNWLIQAPKLESFAVFDLDADVFDAVGRAIVMGIARARSIFPALRHIRLHAWRGTTFLAPAHPKGLHDSDIMSWRTSGLEVDIES